MPGEEAARESPPDLSIPLDRREQQTPSVDEVFRIDRRSEPRLEREPIFASALKQVARRIEPRRDPAEVLLDQARAFETVSEPHRAFEALRASLLLRPLDARPVRDLERIAGVLGLRRALAGIYEQVLTARPDHPGRAAIRHRIRTLHTLAEADEAAGAPQPNPLAPRETTPGPENGALPWTPGPGVALQQAPESDVEILELGDSPAEPIQMMAPEGAFEPMVQRQETQPEPVAPTARWELSAPGGVDARVTPPALHRTREPAPALEDAATLDAALAALPITPGPAAAAPPRANNRSQPRAIHGRVAPLWRRFLAFGVDGAVILALPLAFLLAALRGVTTGSPVDVLVDVIVAHGAALGASTAMVGVTGFVYLTLFGAMGGRTLGDRLLGMCAVDALSGTPPGIGRAAFRAAGAVVGTAAFLAGPLWSLFDSRGQALHDKLAGTVKVILEPASAR